MSIEEAIVMAVIVAAAVVKLMGFAYWRGKRSVHQEELRGTAKLGYVFTDLYQACAKLRDLRKADRARGVALEMHVARITGLIDQADELYDIEQASGNVTPPGRRR